MDNERLLEEKLKDAHSLVREARGELGHAVKRRDEANGYLATRRAKLDQALAWAAALQAEFDARPPVEPTEEPAC